VKQYKFLFLLLWFVTIFKAGCVSLSASSHNVNALKDEIAQLQIEYRELKQNHADLYAKVDSSLVTIDMFSASIRDLQNKISVLNQTVHDLEVNTSKKSGNDYGSFMSPLSFYRGAYSDYSMGKFELACSGFQSFVDKYSDAELAPQAQFYIGECFYSRSMWLQALEEYKKVEEHYRGSDLVSSARLKMGLCYELLGKKNEASNVFSSIVNDFPQNQESLTAKEKLRIYENVETR
jgi:tol-pal system protein YbgF